MAKNIDISKKKTTAKQDKLLAALMRKSHGDLVDIIVDLAEMHNSLTKKINNMIG